MNIWRERLARWFDPLARRCPLSPNAISLIALGVNLIAASCLFGGGRRPALYLVAVALVVIGGLADAFDGIVARAQHKESRYGDFIDHVADRVSDICLAGGWLLGNGVREELALATVIAIMLNGYLFTQIEATFNEHAYDSVGRGEFVLALIIYPITSYLLAVCQWSALQLGGLRISEWMTLLLIAFAVLAIVQRLALAARLGRTP
ncbi:MAG TPA: CDP-alcohol phosphatidyltransferase family protein [Thermoanaerobaculia bacterium]|nr:CDP-alcohol phosphatidyltransferase family protein [Thermoanaerobaculia bacterium]